MLDHLTERAAAWLRFQNRAARGVMVTIRYGDYEFAEGRTALRRPTAGEQELKEAARDRFARLCTRRLPLRLLGVTLSPVVPPDGQASLFPDPAEERRRRLNECVDAVRQRFGFLAHDDGGVAGAVGETGTGSGELQAADAVSDAVRAAYAAGQPH